MDRPEPGGATRARERQTRVVGAGERMPRFVQWFWATGFPVGQTIVQMLEPRGMLHCRLCSRTVAVTTGNNLVSGSSCITMVTSH